MGFVTEWVMQIIVFVLLGTIVELLIPRNTMKKYVNIVIGLLLLLILAKPILYLFSIDVTSQLNRIERSIFEDNLILKETETLVEKQKREIQAEQDAYIWNEVKSQLIKEGNPILIEQFSVQITDLAFAFDDPFVDKYDNLEKIIVTLRENRPEDDRETEKIEPIIIEAKENRTPKRKRNKEEREISKTLEELWGLNKTNIEIKWEGGTS